MIKTLTKFNALPWKIIMDRFYDQTEVNLAVTELLRTGLISSVPMTVPHERIFTFSTDHICPVQYSVDLVRRKGGF